MANSCFLFAVLSAALWSASASATRSSPEDEFVPIWNVSVRLAQAPQLIPAGGLLLVSAVEAGWATVHAFDESSGRLMWRWNSSWTGSENLPGPAHYLSPQAPDTIFFAQQDGTGMAALNLSTGSVRWTSNALEEGCSYLGVSPDGTTIFIGGYPYVVQAIDIASGALLWTLPMDYVVGITAASCGQPATGCVVVLQCSSNYIGSLVFLDGRSGAQLSSAIVSVDFTGAWTVPLTAGSVIVVTLENTFFGYSSVNYTLLWYQSVSDFEDWATYPAGLAGWKTPSVLLATETSISIQDATVGQDRWRVRADLCDDQLPPNFACSWNPKVAGLFEPREHAVGVAASCYCVNELNSSDSFQVSRFLALNTSNGVPLWAHSAPTMDTSSIVPSADGTVTLKEQDRTNTSIRVHDSVSFRFLQAWVVPNAPMGPFASSNQVLFLLDLPVGGGFNVTGFTRGPR